MGTRSLAGRNQAGDLFQGAGGGVGAVAGVIPSTWAAMVVMRLSGTPSSLAACAVSVP